MEPIEQAARELKRFTSADLEAKGFGRGQVRGFLRRCRIDGARPGSKGQPVTVWRVKGVDGGR